VDVALVLAAVEVVLVEVALVEVALVEVALVLASVEEALVLTSGLGLALKLVLATPTSSVRTPPAAPTSRASGPSSSLEGPLQLVLLLLPHHGHTVESSTDATDESSTDALDESVVVDSDTTTLGAVAVAVAKGCCAKKVARRAGSLADAGMNSADTSARASSNVGDGDGEGDDVMRRCRAVE
jgi:hypothetical protein